ncbi:ribonuclease H-like domain-containing protein [Tanacetum coccineum]
MVTTEERCARSRATDTAIPPDYISHHKCFCKSQPRIQDTGNYHDVMPLCKLDEASFHLSEETIVSPCDMYDFMEFLSLLGFGISIPLIGIRLRRYKVVLLQMVALQLEVPIGGSQLDVKNAFYIGMLSESVYMRTTWFWDPAIITSLHAEFSMINLGLLKLFLGHFVTRMLRDNGAHIADSTLYRSLAGALQYLTFTRPDISYAVQQVCLFMHDPREPHLSALKRILRYVRGTLSYGLQLYSSTTSSLVAYSDADWAGCPTTRRSTSGYCVFLGNNLLSWSSKRQFTLSRSSAEAEYRGVANAVAETCWLRNLLRELHTPLATATLVYCDNVSAVYLSSNPVQHQRTKHIEIDIHFVRDLVATGAIRVLHVPSRYQYADIFTKGLPTSLFDEFRTSLSVRCPPAPTAGEFDPLVAVAIKVSLFLIGCGSFMIGVDAKDMVVLVGI